LITAHGRGILGSHCTLVMVGSGSVPACPRH
jgi:hypothetical protein